MDESDLIKSLMELNKGDIVDFEEHGACIVNAIGDVPEHDREVNLYLLYKPGVFNKDIIYKKIVLKESDFLENNPARDLNIRRLDKKDYSGWKYLEIKRV